MQQEEKNNKIPHNFYFSNIQLNICWVKWHETESLHMVYCFGWAGYSLLRNTFIMWITENAGFLHLLQNQKLSQKEYSFLQH